MKMNAKYIETLIVENRYSLLGQIEVSDNDYKELIAFVGEKVNNLKTNSGYYSTIISADLVLSLALVQVAIRKYREGRFWPCFEEEIGYNLTTTKSNHIGKIFFKTIKQYGLFMPRIDDGDFQYVEYIKAHAFITHHYMQGFYDFSYAYYENNLFRQLKMETIEEDLEDLSSFMKTTLNNKNDKIVETGSNKAAKSYKLLKSTRTAFAICDSKTISDLFLPILKLIDNYFYDNEIPQVSQNRYEEAFVEWCRIQDAKSNQKKEKNIRNRKEYSHKPYISVNADKEYSYVVVPPQKFRIEDCDGYANVIIEVNGYEENIELEVYKSFGIYITEEITIPIPSIFDSINLTIKTLSEKYYHIPASNYRIFDRQWKYRTRFDIGYNYILVRQGVPTKWENRQDEIDSYDGYENWNYFSAKINEESIFYVGNKPISIIGEFSAEPIFERKIEHFRAFEKTGSEIIVTREHPAISFVVEKEKLNGSILSINGIRYQLENIKEKICYDWPEDKNKFAVSVPLNVILPIEDKLYDVLLDVPGEGNKKLCRYLLLKKFDCRFNKPRYTYDKTATLKITKGDCMFDITDELWDIESESDKSISYAIPLEKSLETAELILYAYDEYKIVMPIRVFKYGFSLTSMISQYSDFIWYADLQEILYVTIPGANRVSAYYGKLDTVKMQGTKISEGTFRIDISEFVRHIKESDKTFHYINLEYEDNAIRKLHLPIIYRRIIIEPYFKLFIDNGVPYTELSIKGNSKLYLKVEAIDGSVVFDKKLITNGKNTFPELSCDEFYNFYPFVEEGSKFSFNTKQTTLQPLENVGCIDLDNLTNCEIVIRDLISNEQKLPLNYEYHINLTKREDDITYSGFMWGKKILKVFGNGKNCYERDADGRYIKKKMGKVSVFVTRIENDISIAIRTYSYLDEDWRSVYYDTTQKALVHYDDELLDSTDDKNRFVFLDEYDTDTLFIVDTNRIRKHREC